MIDAVITGTALESFGLTTGYGTVEGLTLNTFGFLVPCTAIWDTADESVSTTWAACADGTVTLETCVD